MATTAAPPRPREQSRARYPDRTGFVERDGLRSFYEVYGSGDPPILFVPTWSIVHARIWKFQIPWFAASHRVVTFDALGNGRSDRPLGPLAYAERGFARDIRLVMDATGLDRAVLVSLSLGAPRSLIVAAEHPDRVAGLVFIGPAVPLGKRPQSRSYAFDDPLDTERGLGEVQPALLASRLRTVPLVLLRRGCSPNATRPSRSKTRSAGASRPILRRSSRPTAVRACRRSRRSSSPAALDARPS